MDVISVTVSLETPALQITVQSDWLPYYDPMLGADVLTIPGFGIRPDGTVYYDALNVDSEGAWPGEAAQVGINLNAGIIPGMSLMRFVPPTGFEQSPPRAPYWTANHTLDLPAPSPPRASYWMADHTLDSSAPGPPKPAYWTAPVPDAPTAVAAAGPEYWTHAHPSPAPLIPVRPVTRFV